MSSPKSSPSVLVDEDGEMTDQVRDIVDILMRYVYIMVCS